MTLGDIIKDYRLNHGISQSDFSKLSGITKGYISMLENNKNPKSGKPIAPTYKMFQKVAYAIGIPINELFLQVDSTQPFNMDCCDENPDEITPDDSDFFSLYQQLDDTGKELVKSYTKGLVDSGNYLLSPTASGESAV